MYPALHRMERRGWIEAEWGLSESKRKAKYYQLTNAGRVQLKEKTKTWQSLVGAMASVLVRACKGGAMMGILDSLGARLPAIDSRPISQVDQEIFDELEFHIAMRTEENMNLGMTADAARSAALVRFGDFAAVQQRCRRALLGERIMWQRIQMGLSVVLLGAVAVLAVQLYNGQRANRESIDDIASALKRLTPPAAGGAALVADEKAAKAESPATAEDPGKSYPIALKGDSAGEFESLSVDFGKLKLRGKAITVVPISTDVGVTGAVVIGKGTYTYTPEKGKEFSGQFRAAMLRFNPKDADAIIKFSAGKAVTDKGALELAQCVVARAVQHCWQSNGDALIPSPRTIAAVVYSRELGDVLFSGDDTTAVVYDFTDNKSLYEKN